MKKRYPLASLNTEELRNTFISFKKGYVAYRMVMDASGIGERADDAVCEGLTLKNWNCAKFKDADESFPYYGRMYAFIGSNIFTCCALLPASQVIDDDR
jgi:hypothetical protein